MSTLAAARADNFYYPPGWDPSKGSLNKFQGSHGALGKRANKLDQGILVIRFEMPFNVWCLGCNHLVGKGVRFNAEKKQIGMYHSTRIWSFKMRTPCCQTALEVHTDPKNAEYVIVSGARRKEESFDAAAAGTAELDPEAAQRRAADAFARLEHGEADRAVARLDAVDIAVLREDNEAKCGDDYEINKRLRRRMRVARGEEKARDAQRVALGLPEHIPLLPESGQDALRASAVIYGGGDQMFRDNWKKARRAIAGSSIFSAGAVAAAAGGKRPAPAPAAPAGRARRGAGGSKVQRLVAKLRLTEPDRRVAA